MESPPRGPHCHPSTTAFASAMSFARYSTSSMSRASAIAVISCDGTCESLTRSPIVGFWHKDIGRWKVAPEHLSGEELIPTYWMKIPEVPQAVVICY